MPRTMKKNEQRVPVTTLAQLRGAQRANKEQQQALAVRVEYSLQTLRRSLSVGNILLSAVNGWAGVLRHINSFRRGYRIVTSFMESLRRRWK